jgi:ABC-2 type transport system permease protein
VNTLALRWRQWRALFAIYFQDGLAYRAQGFIWVLTDVVTAFIMPQVWMAAGRGSSIAGYTSSDFVVYYLCMLLLTSFITSHFMWDISTEIKDGAFSTHLIRPIPYMQFMLVRNFSWRIIRFSLFVPWCLLFFWMYSSQITDARFFFGWEFWASVALGHLVSVTTVVALSMIALFTEEAQAIFELYYVPAMFLSGVLFPISVLPDWARAIASWLPYYYTVGAPTEILIGRVPPGEIHRIILMQVGWIAAALVLYTLLKRAGLKRYTGVGM